MIGLESIALFDRGWFCGSKGFGISGSVAFLMSFENFNTTLFLVGSDTTLPISLYLQVRDGSTPLINAISFVLIVSTSILALINLLLSRKKVD